MKKVDFKYLKENPETDCFVIVTGYPNNLHAIEIGFIFDKIVANIPKDILKLKFSDGYMANYPDTVIIELSDENEIGFNGTIFGKVVMDVKSQIWAITHQTTVSSKKRVVYNRNFESKKDADLFISQTLSMEFNPRSFLVEEYDTED